MHRIEALPGDDRSNGWLRILAPREPRPPLQGDAAADWLVIGAGLTGLAAARRLAENRPDERIVLLDAQAVGEGASGRNSGFAIDLPHNVGGDLTDLTASHRAMRLSRAAIASLEGLVTRYQIRCQWSRRGQYMAASSPQGEQALEPFLAELGALGEAHSILGRDEIAERLGSRYYRKAVHTPGTVLLQPAALVRGLAETLPANVTLHENTPVTAIDYGGAVTVEASGGRLRANKAVIAVNGFAPQFGFHRRRLFTLRLFASITRPLSAAERASLGSESDWGIVPAMPFGAPTLRYTQDHRLLMRSRIVFAATQHSNETDNLRARRLHERQLRDRFPQLTEVGFEHSWTGHICLSQNFAPGFGQAAPNVFLAVCQNGVGITKGTIGGLLAADLACGRDNPLIADMLALGQPSRLPPRPFLDLGATAKLAWWRWKSRSER